MVTTRQRRIGKDLTENIGMTLPLYPRLRATAARAATARSGIALLLAGNWMLQELISFTQLAFGMLPTLLG